MSLTGLAGKVAVVTGAAQGIGAAIVQRLLEEGCNVVAVDVQRETLQQLAIGLNKSSLHVVAADAASEAGCALYARAAVERFGSLDLMVNNIGIMGPVLPITEIELTDFEKMFAINVRSVFLGLRVALRQMQLQGQGGAVVNVSSMAAIKAAPMRSLYGATKRAIIGLSNSAAMENGKFNIRVNTILPGGVDTPMGKVFDESRAKLGKAPVAEAYPLGRKAEPSEIAAFTAWLLSGGSSYQTGGVYTIDGGASC